LPDLEDATMLPGEVVRGGISFQLPVVADLSQVVYTGYHEIQRFYLLADLVTMQDV